METALASRALAASQLRSRLPWRPLRRSATSHKQDDLAELAAGGEALVGLGDGFERERGGHRHAELAGVEQRQHVALHEASAGRLLLQRTGAQSRAVDPRALAHQREQVELGLEAR